MTWILSLRPVRYDKIASNGATFDTVFNRLVLKSRATHRTTSGPGLSRDNLHGGGLPGAVVPEQAEDLPPLDGEAEARHAGLAGALARPAAPALARAADFELLAKVLRRDRLEINNVEAIIHGYF